VNRKRDKARPTRFKGVKVIVPGELYLVRGTWIDPKTDLKRSFREQIEAPDAETAAAIRLDMLREAKAGKQAEPMPRLLAFGKSWLRSKRGEVEPSTYEKFKYTVAHICETFGDHYIDRIETRDVKAWRDSQTDYANSTVNGWLSVFRLMMRDAVHDYRLPFDPTEGVRALSEVEPERCLEPAKLDALLVAVLTVAPQWFALVAVLALTGLRFGEASALKWTDIDWEGREIYVRRAHWRGRIGKPKTGKRRTAVLGPFLADVLREHRKQQISTQHPALEGGWVFASSRGTLLSSGVLTKPLRKACKHAKIDEPVSAHWLRHTYSNEARRKSDLQTQKALTGHTSDRSAIRYSAVSLNERLAVVSEIESEVARKVAHLWSGGSDEGGEA
jgi:integrase